MRNIYRCLIIIFVLSFNLSAFAQDEALVEDRFADLIFPSKEHIMPLKPPLKLPPLEEARFKKYRQAFIDQFLTQRSDNKDEMCHAGNVRAEDFYAYDFNGDGIDDIMFSSYCGGEEIRNHFWLQVKNDAIQYAGFVEGTPLKLFRKNKSGTKSIAVSKGWCCAGYVGSVTLYKLAKNEQGNLVYLPSKKVMQFGGVSLPKTRMAPVRFLIEKDKYQLRRSPEIYDERDDYMSDLTGVTFYGNILSEFSKGSQGEAIAEQRDKTGRVWWFVVMDKEAKTTTNHFYDDENGYKTGWMDSKYLKKISAVK